MRLSFYPYLPSPFPGLEYVLMDVTGGCLIVADYVSELKEEDVPDYPPPAEITARAPPFVTTYNYTRRYPFSTPESSFGQYNPANV